MAIFPCPWRFPTRCIQAWTTNIWMADDSTNDIQNPIFRHQELPTTAIKTDANITCTAASCQSGLKWYRFRVFPAAPATTLTIAFQADSLNPTNISASVPWAMNSAPGLMRIAGDLGGMASVPTVLSVSNLTNPVPLFKGGTGQATQAAAFKGLTRGGSFGRMGLAVHQYRHVPDGSFSKMKNTSCYSLSSIIGARTLYPKLCPVAAWMRWDSSYRGALNAACSHAKMKPSNLR